MPRAEWNEQASRRIADADWVALSEALMESAAPWPRLGAAGPGSGTNSPVTSENRSPEGTKARVFSPKQIYAAESTLLDAYMQTNSAYRVSNQAQVDARLMEVQDALEKLATMLGLDPFRELPAQTPG